LTPNLRGIKLVLEKHLQVGKTSWDARTNVSTVSSNGFAGGNVGRISLTRARHGHAGESFPDYKLIEFVVAAFVAPRCFGVVDKPAGAGASK
jgi:hypothetical protein